MKSLSSTRKSTEDQPQKSGHRTSDTPSSNIFSAKQAQADITESVSSILAVSNKLEQDSMEGVDANEWVRKWCYMQGCRATGILTCANIRIIPMFLFYFRMISHLTSAHQCKGHL